MNRMQMDDFCAENGTESRKDDDKWYELTTALLITRSVMSGSKLHFQTELSLADIAPAATKQEMMRGNVCGSAVKHLTRPMGNAEF